MSRGTSRTDLTRALAAAALIAGCAEKAPEGVDRPPAAGETRHGAFSLFFPEALTGDELIEIVRAGERMRFAVRQLRFVEPEGHVTRELPLAQPPRTVEGSAIRYGDLSPQVDLRFDLEEGGVSQYVVLRDRSMLPAKEEASRLEIVELIDIGDLDIHIEGKLRAKPLAAATTEPISLSRGGVPIFRIPPPLVRDAAGQTSYIDTRFDLWVNEQGQGVLITQVELDLLLDPALQYPLSIDPHTAWACSAGGGPEQCEDGSRCTADACDVATGTCRYTPANVGESCWSTGTCTEDGICSFAGAGAPCEQRCDDGNPCTVDTCDAAGACEHEAAENGTPCAGGAGACQDAVCVATLAPCDDVNACTVDTVNPDGSCSNVAVPDSEEKSCWGIGTCVGGACDISGVLGKAVCQPWKCWDGNPCTTDVCLPDGSCANTPTNYGEACAGGSGTCNERGDCAVDLAAAHCALEGQVRSVRSTDATSLEIRNYETTPLTVYPLDEMGRRGTPFSVSRYSVHRMSTFITHAFLVEREGQCLGIYEMTWPLNVITFGEGNPCTPNPCLSYGTCDVDSAGAAVCTCPSGTSGERCERALGCVDVLAHCDPTSPVLTTLCGFGPHVLLPRIAFYAGYVRFDEDATRVTLVSCDGQTEHVTGDANLCDLGLNDSLCAVMVRH